MQKLLKTIQTLSCWYSLERSRRVLSDEYPFARFSVIFQVFSHDFVLAKSVTSSIRAKYQTPVQRVFLVSVLPCEVPGLAALVLHGL